MAENEIYKDVPNHTNYQVSNLGNVKSKSFTVIRKDGKPYTNKGRILKQSINGNYLCICLDGNKKYVHHLVAAAFLNHKTNRHIVIDHIDKNKLNNKLDNFQLITNRENCSREVRGKSEYVGVSWCKAREKWLSKIQINGKYKQIGRYKNEYDAHVAYQTELKNIAI